MSRIEIFRGQARRRWSDEAKRRLVAETLVPGATVHAVAQRHGVNTSQLFTWRKRFGTDLGLPPAVPPVRAFAGVELVLGASETRRIKADPELRAIPVVVVTSYALSGDDAKAKAAGCDAYVAKPFSPRAPLGTIRQFLAEDQG